jgi:hypothetical protein
MGKGSQGGRNARSKTVARNGVIWAKDVERLEERGEELRDLRGGKVFLGVKTENGEGVLKKPERLLVCSKLFKK